MGQLTLGGDVDTFVKLQKPYRGLYAAQPGTGPVGETCGSCRHKRRMSMANTWHKCELVQFGWTGGEATDIRLRTPACSKWEAPL